MDGQWDPGQLSRAIDGGVVLADADGRTLLHNEAAETLLGGAEGFERGWRFVHDCIARDVDRARLQHERAASLNVALPREWGERTLYLRILPTDDGGCLVLFKERRALDALQADLRLAAQMRHLHRSFRQAAHDLRAPLHSLTLNVDLLRGDIAAAASHPELAAREARERLDLVSREIARLSRMLQDLLSQSGPPRDRLRIFGLRRLLTEVLALVRPEATRQRVATRLRLPPERVAVLGARDHLKQALVNLLANALEAMPDGGELAVELVVEDGRAVVRLRDSGQGMSPEVLARAFRMHYTTKPGGSGIGLFTARAVIESLGGSLELQSQEGSGTVAVIGLPLAAFDAPKQVVCSPS
ncbi:MAG TPA: ATP-binding protein [Planctomycetota bacterium]|nr:ATP-binding protein [Planctomycetota bacterium]